MKLKNLASSGKNKERRRYKLTALWIVLAFLVITELVLRLGFGFCRAVLYRTDLDFEYIPVPQETRRFGNHIYYNSFSQRNEEISPADSVVILGFGDSVINGGTETDNDSLATTRISKYLTAKYRKKVKVVNISSQSWGPDNCFAYLKKYGSFNAKAMFLVLSSHDAYDNMDFEKVVGVNPSFPDKQYPLAIFELLGRYVLPRVLPSNEHVHSNNGSGINKRKPGSRFNPGIYNLFHYAGSHHLPFVIYLHADAEELANKAYSRSGQEIIALCNKNQIPLIKELDYHMLNKESYRDGIHLNNRGQYQMYTILRDKVYNSHRP